ncbi:MAG: GatB/YqeY domain-containing protein [Candidatus Moranbacteria bacterium]|nr:GatB/YqeY domain-containing protein [Candidatus Moranbacteria bacterium]
MKISEKIKKDLIQAMKTGEAEKRDTLRMLDSMIKNEEIANNSREEGLSDDDVLVLVKRAVKQRRDSIEQFQAGGRKDLADKEKMELDIISEYLPMQISDEELEKIVKEIIVEVGAESKADMGKVMGLVIGKAGSLADGGRVKDMVMKNLG